MGNKQEPAKSLRFHHGTRRCKRAIGSEKSFSVCLVFSVESCNMASKTKGQFVSVGFITNWNFEMLAAMCKVDDSIKHALNISVSCAIILIILAELV